MKKTLQKIVITWIALMGIMGLSKEKLGRNKHQVKMTADRNEVMLDEFEVSSYHSSE